MFLGWKIDDPARAFKRPVFRYEHSADFDFLVFAGVLVIPEIPRKRLLKH